MSRTDSSKRSSSSDPEDAEIVYLKDNVTIHPTQYATERISGRLKLIKQGSSLFMTWIPYKGQSSNARLSERDKNLYTIRAIPFSDIQSIRRHTPTIGWQYVIVVLSSGLAYPPLYFYSGGVREFLATIKQHVLIARSSEDANVFLVNNFQDPLQRTLSSLELPRSLAKGSPSSSFKGTPSDERLDKGTLEDNQLSNNIQQNNRQRQKNHDPARDISIQVLEKFSLVTRFARETTSQLFRESLVDGHGPAEKRRNNWASKDHQRQEIASNDVDDDVPKRVPVASDPLEFEKLSLVWGQPRQHPLGLEEWSTFLDSEGRVGDPNALKKRIFYGGVEHNLRKEVWGFLLGYYSYDSTYAERQYVVSVKKSEYETIKNQWQFEKLSLVWGQPRQHPLGLEEWSTFLDSEGRVGDPNALKKRIFYGGVEHNLRKEVWGFLLGYYSYDSTYAERQYVVSVKKSEYETIKNQWQSISPEQAKRFTKFRERRGLIEKDVVRTDRSLSFYDGDDNPNGMSDLLSPILFIMKDESEAFWCFVSLLERLGPNFNRDQNGMHSQLFALSKFLLLEFEYEKTLRLWEVLWTHYPTEHLHLYVCIAILKRHRVKIMGEQMDFDTLLKFINELSGQIDLDPVLRDAEALCVCAGENGAASIPPGTPPSLPLQDGSIYQQQDDEVL
ncbi:rabGAP/TBC domain-containing protein [Artemisia annua]|uniref:RabGAP/TBC domain-containing protein n=1 Tax=Artemisia annua TaxID=35608 RepID=A0A2U1P4C8_ARTAN|nr:rabGAP/TBC domain-containing protein [Artemisia annua]